MKGNGLVKLADSLKKKLKKKKIGYNPKGLLRDEVKRQKKLKEIMDADK